MRDPHSSDAELPLIAELALPSGYTARPASMSDLEAAVNLQNACSQHMLGQTTVTIDTVRNEWSTPGSSLDTDTLCVFTETGDLVGYGEVWGSAPHTALWSRGRVHPAHCGRGLGSYLINWEETRAGNAINLAPAKARVTLHQRQRDEAWDARALLDAHGYQVVRRFHEMRIELGITQWPRRFPKDIAVRTFSRNADLPAVIAANQDAFRDHWGFITRPFGKELARWVRMMDDPGFDPSLWFLAMNGDEIAGLCLCRSSTTEDPEMGWVNILGVRHPWRQHGVGLALLYEAFEALQYRGCRRVGLNVDAGNLTGAIQLYERAGMHMHSITHVYQKVLRAGIELSVQKTES